MHIDVITALLADLEAGFITWEQALKQVTALPTVWHTAEWKRQRDALIGTACAVCATTDGPFVLQHLTPSPHFKEVCQTVKQELRNQLLPQMEAQVTAADVAAHVGPGDERQACPTCASVSIRERKTMQPRYVCSRGEKGWHAFPYFDVPFTVRYYTKQKTTDHASAMEMAREFLVSVAMVAEVRKYDQAIQHEATLRSLRQTLVYRSLKDTATYCKKCAFKEDLPLIQRKIYAS
ncbi:hypothetical protein [Hymenobacter sp. 5414T-23]|uniref:hypothetical protein n=1 Tax=Hymenobacter sp. 5414T-23 TaxID=2932252 RepID=UPI001FD4D76B|nr:hypothetical protein [Hymenobacter sp. 5414T-23]UOQ83264.1 hypothetical protein MUN83_21275 [Hymenobacter sp. 5414T-23]